MHRKKKGNLEEEDVDEELDIGIVTNVDVHSSTLVNDNVYEDGDNK